MAARQTLPTHELLGWRRLLAKSADGRQGEPMRAAGGVPPPEVCALAAAQAGPGGRSAMAGGGDALRALLCAANALLQQHRYRAALAVLKGFRNGAV